MEQQQILLRNNVKLRGSGPETIVFGHGFACDQMMWRFVEPTFRNGFQTLVYDLTGNGQSDANQYDTEIYSSIDGHVNDLLTILDDQALSSVTFVGHSVSGMIGMLAAVKAPERFRRLIMIGSSPRYINDSDYVGGFEPQAVEQLLATLESNYVGWAIGASPSLMGNPARPELSDELTQTLCSNDPTVASHFARTIFHIDLRKSLVLCRAPTLILQCADDAIVPVEVGNYLHRHLLDSKLTLLNATGHYPHLSAPEEIVECVRQFLV